jgi:hypothetical protein
MQAAPQPKPKGATLVPKNTSRAKFHDPWIHKAGHGVPSGPASVTCNAVQHCSFQEGKGLREI